jgi:hypothetical protein
MLPATSVIPPGKRAVTGELWRGRYYTMASLDAADKTPEEMRSATRARQKRFERARNELQEAAIVGGRNDQWWIG